MTNDASAAFPADSHAAELLASVSAAVDELSGSSAAQAAGTDIARAGTANRHLSREALTEDLEKHGGGDWPLLRSTRRAIDPPFMAG